MFVVSLFELNYVNVDYTSTLDCVKAKFFLKASFKRLFGVRIATPYSVLLRVICARLLMLQ